ncbi:hypothetical protein [Pseudomonas sp. TE3610]
MTAVEELTEHLLELSNKQALERGAVKQMATNLARRSEAFVTIVESALSKPREAKLLSHVRVVRMMVLTHGSVSTDLELTGIKVQAAGMELDFTPEIHHRDSADYIRVIVRNGLDDRMTIAEAAEGSWQLQSPGADATVPADEEAIAGLLLDRLKKTVQPRSHSFTHTPYLSFANRNHR